jgi:hypothetical protein
MSMITYGELLLDGGAYGARWKNPSDIGSKGTPPGKGDLR